MVSPRSSSREEENKGTLFSDSSILVGEPSQPKKGKKAPLGDLVSHFPEVCEEKCEPRRGAEHGVLGPGLEHFLRRISFCPRAPLGNTTRRKATLMAELPSRS